MTKALPEGFPRIEDQSRKQMKDVELVANLLLTLEGGLKGYSQDELDQAFSDREDAWSESASSQTAFLETLSCLCQIVSKPTTAPLFKTRLRNQADFYSLFTAIAECRRRAGFNCADDIHVTRLTAFLGIVEDEPERNNSPAATDYFKAARSNSNDSGPRKKRHEIIRRVLENSLNDYASADPEQV